MFGIPAILGGLARLGPAAARGYRTFKTAQRAGSFGGRARPDKFSIGYQGTPAQRIVQGTGKKFGQAERRLRGGFGTAEAGLGALTTVEGSRQAAQGIVDRDASQVATGLGTALLGLPFIPRGIRMLGASKTGRKVGLAKTGMAARDIMKNQRKGSTAAGLGLVGTGVASEYVFGSPIPANEIMADKYDAIIDAEAKKQGITLTPEQRKSLKEKLIAAEKQTTTNNQAAGTESYTQSDDVKTTQNTIPGSDRDKDTLATMAKDNKNKNDANRSSADKLKNQTEFKKYYDSIMDLTGGDDDTANLLLLKFASGLMSGKTGQEGVRGLADVVGQAVGSTAETAIALSIKDKENKKDMATAYMKAKLKQADKGGISEKRFMRLIPDPDALGDQKVVETAIMADGPMKGYEAIYVEGQGYVPIDPTKAGSRIEYDKNAIATLGYEMDALGGAQQMVELIKSTPNELVGIGGNIRGITDNAILSAKEVFNTSVGLAYGADASRAIKANLDGDLVEKYDKDLEAKTEELSERFKPFGRLSSEQRARVAELAVIETNLAYAYANALKGKDRLTEKNIDDAMKSVQIFGLRSAEVVKDRIAAIERRINSSFDAKVKSFQIAGGDNAILINKYNYMPMIKNHLGAKDQARIQAEAQKRAEEEIAGINLK